MSEDTGATQHNLTHLATNIMWANMYLLKHNIHDYSLCRSTVVYVIIVSKDTEISLCHLTE